MDINSSDNPTTVLFLSLFLKNVVEPRQCIRSSTSDPFQAILVILNFRSITHVFFFYFSRLVTLMKLQMKRKSQIMHRCQPLRFFRNCYEFRAKITVLRSTVYLLRISDYCWPETVPHLNIVII